jgi:hypothetical protein
MGDARHSEARALIELAESARGVFDFLLTLADDMFEEDPSVAERCLARANQLADATTRALRVLDADEREWITNAIERDHLEREAELS